MTADPSTTRTRRAVLGAAIGGAAAVAATSIRPLAARAVEPPVLLGAANTATAPTSVENTDPGEVSLAGTYNGSGTGVSGSSVTGAGIWGASLDTTATADWAHSVAQDRRLRYRGRHRQRVSANTDETGVYGYADLSEYSHGRLGRVRPRVRRVRLRVHRDLWRR